MQGLYELYDHLSKKGMINMSIEEFSQLPQKEISKYLSIVQQPTNQEPLERQMYQEGGEGFSLTNTGNGMNAQKKANTVNGFIGIASTIGSMGGNLLKDPKHPTSARNVAGNLLSSTAQGAAMGSAFGPWGALIGAGIGTIKGAIESGIQRKQYKEDVQDRSRGRVIMGLDNRLNPELRNGGYNYRKGGMCYGEGGDVDDYSSFNPKEGDYAELERVKNLPFKRFGSYGGKLSIDSKVRKAGSFARYENGGTNYRPNIYLQDGGDAANAEIEGGEAVIGNPQSVDLYGGADYDTSSPVGFMAKGAQHGQMNSAGTEGIPMGSDEPVYIGSDKLALDGWKATKGKKSVAQEMKPYLEYAAKASESNDPYLNNPKALASIQNSLEELQVKAEQGKFMKNLYDLLKRKDRDFREVESFIMQEMPNEMEALANQQPVNQMMNNQQMSNQIVDEQQVEPEMMRRGGWIQDVKESIKKRYGGTLKVGQRIRFQQGGTIYEGTVKHYNPLNGDFELI